LPNDVAVPEDKISINNKCTSAEHECIEVTLKDLSLKKVQSDTILWVENMFGACMIDAVTLVVKDRNGHLIALALYN